MSSLTGYHGSTGNQLRGTSSKTSTGFREKRPHGYQKASLQQFTPEQLELFQELFSYLQPDSYLSRLAGGDEATFAELEAPALKQFGALQGGLASRFSGMGMGGRKSSGFQNTSTQAASDFAQQLQAQRQGLQRQALMDLMGLSQNLLNQRPYEQFYVPKSRNSSAEAWGRIGGAVPGLISSFTGGGSMGDALKGAFSIFGGGGGGGSASGYDQSFRMSGVPGF